VVVDGVGGTEVGAGKQTVERVVVGGSDDDNTLKTDRHPYGVATTSSRGPAHYSGVVCMQGSPAVALLALACGNVALVPYCFC
jgi:hypothetical protein